MLDLADAFMTPASYDSAARVQTGAVYTADGRLVESAQRPPVGVWRHVDAPVLDAAARASASTTLERAVYGGRYYAHFGHFVIETAPALHQAAPHAEIIVCHPNPAELNRTQIAEQFRGYMLRALGVAPRRIRLVDQLTRVSNLLVPALEPPPIGGEVGAAFIAACVRIREYALAGRPPRGGRVYLSRRKFVGGSNRRLENEAELEALLARHGFSIVFPERLPIQEQIRIAADADFVAGVDGSALHLCSFMRAGGKVLIVETRPFRTQRSINRALGLTTLSCPASRVGAADGEDVYRVDLNAISACLETAAG